MRFVLSLFLVVMATLFFRSALVAQSDLIPTDSLARELFLDASVKYMDGRLAASIPLYYKLLRLDSVNHVLNRTTWRVVIDNLGMAYGMLGDISSANRVFHNALERDSTYPLFYYNLACGAAENSHMDTCLQYLELAFKYKANVIQSESLPDPSTDDSFKRFMENKEFLAKLKELKGGQK